MYFFLIYFVRTLPYPLSCLFSFSTLQDEWLNIKKCSIIKSKVFKRMLLIESIFVNIPLLNLKYNVSLLILVLWYYWQGKLQDSPPILRILPDAPKFNSSVLCFLESFEVLVHVKIGLGGQVVNLCSLYMFDDFISCNPFFLQFLVFLQLDIEDCIPIY